MDFSWLLGGGLVAALAASLQYLRIVWNKLYSLVITTMTVEFQGSEALLMYLTISGEFGFTRLGTHRYIGVPMRTSRSWRNQMVYWEVISSLGCLFWRNHRPIWATWTPPKNDRSFDFSVYPDATTISFLRGTFDREKLLVSAQTFWEEFTRNSVNDDRYFVQRIYGTNKRAAMSGRNRNDDFINSSASSAHSVNEFRSAVPVGFSRNELGHHAALLGIKHLALDTTTQNAVAEARRWENGRTWYRERGLPWTLGWLLYGQPGNGKTTLARAIAEELRLPIYIYDLASMANDELINAWGEMQAHTPCVALFEDIDAVFNGRTNVANQELTFDCLLNCLDGVEQAEGVFKIITTNDITKIDPALGQATGDGRSTRPGRIGQVLFMDRPTTAGRLVIANRILVDHPERIEAIVAAGEGDTGDQFQTRCFQAASL